MHVEFRRAIIPDEVPELLAFDRKVFPKADLFDREDWMRDDSYWMLVDGAKIGCCAFQADRDFRDDLRKDGRNPPMKGSLYITTTGILPLFQSRGFGKLFKVWQITYARLHHLQSNSDELPYAEYDDHWAEPESWVSILAGDPTLLQWPY
jgi:hypothetical protein